MIQWWAGRSCPDVEGLATQRLIRVRAQILWSCSEPANLTALCFHKTALLPLALCHQTQHCVCVAVCVFAETVMSFRNKEPTTTNMNIQHMTNAPTHVLVSRLLTQFTFRVRKGQWTPAYSCLEVTKQN